MDKCDCYHETNNNIFSNMKWGECWGTPECDLTSCEGDRKKCNFYPEIAEKAKKDEINNPIVKTLSRAEIIDIVNDAARKLNAKVPIEFYERLFSKKC